MARPTETVPLVLRYLGPDVDDGSMAIEDIVPVLQGFSSAYGKIAGLAGRGLEHRIRIVGVEQGSADILLEVWDALSRMADPLTTVSILTTAAGGILAAIVGVIRLKRHVRKQPFSERITQQNTIEITNSEGVRIEMPVYVFNIFKEKLIDSDVSKIVRPLMPGKIDAAEIEAKPKGQEPIRERIEARERGYLESETIEVTRTTETWIVGQLNSLTKSTDSGFLYLTDGQRVFYQYTGDNPQLLHAVFGTYEGPVRLYAVAHLDENLKPTKLEVSAIERMQGELFPVSEPHRPEPGREE